MGIVMLDACTSVRINGVPFLSVCILLYIRLVWCLRFLSHALARASVLTRVHACVRWARACGNGGGKTQAVAANSIDDENDTEEKQQQQKKIKEIHEKNNAAIRSGLSSSTLLF